MFTFFLFRVLISSYCHHTLFITVGTTNPYGHLKLNWGQLGIPNLNTHLKLGWANELILSPRLRLEHGKRYVSSSWGFVQRFVFLS